MKVAAPLLASAFLAACAVAPETPPRPDTPLAPPSHTLGSTNCTPRCVVTIVVPSTCGSGIRVAPDPIVVRMGARSEIRWHVTGRWRFDRVNGIHIHRAGKAFSGHERAADGQSFTVVIEHNDPVIFKYDVNLVGPDERPCQIDPIIVNW